MLCAMARRQATKFIAPSQQQDFPATAESSMEEDEMKLKSLRVAADQLQEDGKLLSARKPEARGSEDAELHGSVQAAPEGGKAAKKSDSESQEKSSAGEDAAASKRSLEVASEGRILSVGPMEVTKQDDATFEVFKCPSCSAEFSSPALLGEHMATHGTATATAPPPASTATATAPPPASTATSANANKPFECPHFSCSKSFATQRGLNKHWNYEPTHRAQPDPPTEWTATPLPGMAAPVNPLTSLSEPTSPHKLEASPIQSPPSTPSSPSFSFRTSSRNPTYLSIIRTRRSSNTDQVVTPVETGVKRSRGAATTGLVPAASPPRAMQPNTEKELAEETEKDGQAKKSKDGQRSQRPRTRSLSGSDSQPGSDLKRSPVTRSSSSTMKTVAFVSLPTRKRRKQSRGQKDTSTDVSPDEGPRKELEKAEDFSAKEAQPQPQQPPVKRKRGRPPKNRNLPPPTSTSTSCASTPTSSVPTSITSNPSSCESATVSSTNSLTNSTVSSGASAESSAAKTPQPMDESPLPSKKSRETAVSSNMPAKTIVNLPLWDSIGETPQPPEPPDDQTETKGPLSPASNPQTLPAKSPEMKARGSELPELPPIQPSVLPPTGCPAALSILQKVSSKPEQPPPIPSTVGPPPRPSAVTTSEASSAAGDVAIHTPAISPSITTLSTYGTTGNGKTVFESVPATSVVNGKERADAEDGDGGLKSAVSGKEAEEPDIVEAKKSTPVEIGLAKRDEMENKMATETKPTVHEATAAAKTPEEQHMLEKREGESPMEVEVGGAAEVGGTKVSPVVKEEASAKTPQLASRGPQEEASAKTPQLASRGPQEEASAKTPQLTSRGPQHTSTTITVNPAATHRPSSVIVSVLSSQERETKREDQPNAKPFKVDAERTTVSSSKPQEVELKPEPRRKLSMTEPSLAPYPPSSVPTPTYSYPYPGVPYPPPPPMMFPPGAPPPSSMYPPYYPYPSVSQPLPTAYIPPGLGMMPMMESGGEGLLQMPHYTGAHPPIATTVTGVRVSILDKPPTHLPTVPPHQMPRPRSMPNAPSQQMEHTPQSLAGQPPVVRSFMGAGSPSPDGPPGMDMSRPSQPHPLSQVYRSSGMMPPPGSGYMPHVSVRLDHNGIPYVDWTSPSGLPPSQQQQRSGAAPKIVPIKMEPKQPQVDDVSLQPVDCPECGRSFKNNKALNGHMRLHGGFDWTKKPFTTFPGLTGSDPNSSNKNGSSASSGAEGASKQNEQKPKKLKPTGVSGTKKRSRSRSISPVPAGRNKKRRTSEDSNTEEAAKTKSASKARPLQPSSNVGNIPVPSAPKVFTFDTQKLRPQDHASSSSSMHDAGTMTQPHRNATLDDLCRAVEELERLENGHKGAEDQDSKRRPKNIVIPHSHSSPALERERHRFGATPPYTPPPILSPARSLTMLAGASLMQNQPCTPSRILQPWSSRRSSDTRHTSESEEGYTEPRINVGKDFQAALSAFEGGDTSKLNHKATRVWKPMEITTHEDDSVIDGFLELACSPAVLYSGRNKEYGLHLLYHLGGSVKEAVRVLLTGKSLFPSNHPLATYNYSGSKSWSARERQQFRRAWRVHRKQFPLLKSTVEFKAFPEIIEYYYTWKKYCSDEYRGRNRHISEEILTDEDDTGYPQLHSSSSSGSAETDPTPPPQTSEGDKTRKYKIKKPDRNAQQPLHFHQQPVSQTMIPDVPLAYAAHTSSNIGVGTPVQQYKCKYPGCNQIFTSIFALNGHIRVHGGSFYPKPPKNEPGSIPSKPQPTSYNFYPNLPISSSGVKITPLLGGGASTSTAFASSKQHRPLTSAPEFRSAHTLELARTLLELPQPRSPARSGSYHTPSPKPSPGTLVAKSKSPGKKKMSSSSPGEREGYYPCNRCGRVFSKVKSRSAHMKSHIIKQN